MPDDIHNPPQPETPEPQTAPAESDNQSLGGHPPRAIESPGDLENLAGEPFVEAGAPFEPAPHDPLVDSAPINREPGALAGQDAPPGRSRLLLELWTLLVAAAGWFLPGAGYLIQRRADLPLANAKIAIQLG